MNYSKVQFISWEINTGPVQEPWPGYPTLLKGYYPGIRLNGAKDDRLDVNSQCVDIEARIAFTANAITQAHKLADASADVLKIFMAPEFLYRGAGGAYLHDLINGWQGAAPAEFNLLAPFNNKWGGLFGGLQALAANDDYKNWLFVFGTAISASLPTFKDTDGKYYLDSKKLGEIYNSSLIQLGGSGNTAAHYASRKHYISGIDFLQWYTRTNTVQYKGHTVLPADPKTLIPADVLGVAEGAAVFNIPNVNDSKGKAIDFGIEICLDHASSGGNGANDYGRLRTANQYVKIQLVPSAGMDLVEDSIRLQPAGGPTTNSYAFNCDGLNNLVPDTEGCHTQIWNGANGAKVPVTSRLFETSNGAQVANTQVARVVSNIMTPGNGQIADTQLWKSGAGSVRVIRTLPL
ncbi:hypothetical protein [Longitalea arenae]|uniref:hypothetical protein n=1 Tax=Longitalea arenae TaxID=2812558 RepID=UPI001967492D|nr:hypothetical protein [Longitalea arenae]